MARKKSTAVVSLAALDKALTKDLSDRAKQMAAAEPATSASTIIRVKNMRFLLNDQILGDSLRVVVIGSAAGLFYYDEPYSPDVKNPPVCFALAPTEAELMPHDSAPEKQHNGLCATCPKNQPGSGDRGGWTRACSLRRRLAVMMADDKSEDPQWASLELSVTAIKPWAKYVQGLAGVHSIPYFLAVTELTFKEDTKKDQWHIEPLFVDKLAAARPDWLTPKSLKVGDEGWFDDTLIGRKVAEVAETKALLVPPSLVAPTPMTTAKGKGKRRVAVGAVPAKKRRRA